MISSTPPPPAPPPRSRENRVILFGQMLVNIPAPLSIWVCKEHAQMAVVQFLGFPHLHFDQRKCGLTDFNQQNQGLFFSTKLFFETVKISKPTNLDTVRSTFIFVRSIFLCTKPAFVVHEIYISSTGSVRNHQLCLRVYNPQKKTKNMFMHFHISE